MTEVEVVEAFKLVIGDSITNASDLGLSNTEEVNLFNWDDPSVVWNVVSKVIMKNPMVMYIELNDAGISGSIMVYTKDPIVRKKK